MSEGLLMQGVNKAFYKNVLVFTMGALLASENVTRCSQNDMSFSGNSMRRSKSDPAMYGSSNRDTEVSTLGKHARIREREHEQQSDSEEDASRSHNTKVGTSGKHEHAHGLRHARHIDEDARDHEGNTRIRKKPNTLAKILVVAAVFYGIWRVGKRIYS